MDTRHQVKLLWKSCQVEFVTLLGTPSFDLGSDFEKLDLDFDPEGQISQVRSSSQRLGMDTRYGMVGWKVAGLNSDVFRYLVQ